MYIHVCVCVCVCVCMYICVSKHTHLSLFSITYLYLSAHTYICYSALLLFTLYCERFLGPETPFAPGLTVFSMTSLGARTSKHKARAVPFPGIVRACPACPAGSAEWLRPAPYHLVSTGWAAQVGSAKCRGSFQSGHSSSIRGRSEFQK